MKLIQSSLSILLLISIVSAAPSWSWEDLIDSGDVHLAWKRFKQAFNRQYSTEQEEQKRFQIFQDNFHFVKDHNDNQYNTGKSTYALGINQFSDMSNEEYQNMFRNAQIERLPSGGIYTDNDVSDLPEEVNWVAKGKVTPIRNQRNCSAGYAFATVASCESVHAIHTGNLVELSEQQIIDCSGVFGNDGCIVGSTVYALQYVLAAMGLDSEKSYPFTGFTGSCSYTDHFVATFNDFFEVNRNDEKTLQVVVAKKGPTTNCIDVSDPKFKSYSKGIYDNPNCAKDFLSLNHGVSVVGYGVQDGHDYWLVKNSWGTDWGMKGYVMMARNKDNQCGIATVANYPVV